MPVRDVTDSCSRTHAQSFYKGLVHLHYYAAANGHVVGVMHFKHPDWPESSGAKCTGPEENASIGGIVEEQEKEQ